MEIAFYQYNIKMLYHIISVFDLLQNILLLRKSINGFLKIFIAISRRNLPKITPIY